MLAALNSAVRRGARRFAPLLVLWWAVVFAAHAQPQFPTLTGRVVDEAGLLSPAARAQLTRALEQHERESSNQVVVVTLKSLQGYTIDDFGYQLGRAWGLGQKEKNNGVLLIIAPSERKVRIEVGYGLEGVLTDALTSDIIQTKIRPQFRQGDYEVGIVAGTQAILAAITGEYTVSPEAKKRGVLNAGSADVPWPVVLIAAVILGHFLANMMPRAVSGLLAGGGAAAVLWFLTGTLVWGVLLGMLIFLFVTVFMGGGGPRFGGPGMGGFGGYGGGGFGGGGGDSFGGGGGSFGGGGASGDW